MYAMERNKNRFTRSTHIYPRARARTRSIGTLFGVAKSLIKVRLAKLAPDAGGARLRDPRTRFY